jgi:hypothetical protein
LDLSNTQGVLYFGLWSALAGLLLQAIVNAAGFLRMRWARVGPSPVTTAADPPG